jgi:hypothetical protein
MVMKGTKDDSHSVVAEAIIAIRKGGSAVNENVCEILTKF